MGRVVEESSEILALVENAKGLGVWKFFKEHRGHQEAVSLKTLWRAAIGSVVTGKNRR